MAKVLGVGQEPGKWNVWGGHCEAAKTPEACVILEQHEEIGSEIADPQTLTFLMTRSFDRREASAFAYKFDRAGTPLVHEGERSGLRPRKLFTW